MTKALVFFSVALGGLAWSSAPYSATASGTINVSITLETGCVVNSQHMLNGDTGGNFGTLGFGSVPTVFTQQDVAVNGGGANGISVVCSSGTTPQFSITSGANDGSVDGGSPGNHAMKNGANVINYAIFTDAARTNQLENGVAVNLAPFTDNTPQTIELYGRAYGSSNVAGAYSDTLNVTLSW
ncbi:spore coat U domain-containing protein [Photobacterium sp. TY1-4]|uniref:Csu type fimbrial protein n=1 Tax=Photobacterium sp. TY1-4 TaxID=2899122 RepID=UPI0021BE13F5|nr:spore coat U domain-containing protein [Photobacterium sp. TY1-4]UXI02015.1 spore coat U domain-containing protein [Photobacterium sp. TY1-4]